MAYVARPFGAVVFGHLGDKIGRKNTLVLTLVLMGSATFLIGALPDFNTVGYWAPALLVLLRLMQGLSAGAETAGASALSTEEAPEGRRGFFASFAMSGISAGIVLASLAFLPVAAMSEADRLAWGWRIPFWLSLMVLVVAYLVRRSLEEPEVFEEKHDHGELVKLPFAKMFKTHPAQFFQVALMSFETVTNTFMQSFGLAYAVSVGVPTSTMLWVSILGNVIAMFSQPLMARLSDRFGRRPVFITGVLGSGLMIFVYFSVISTGNIPMIFLASTLITAGHLRHVQRHLPGLVLRTVQRQGPLLGHGHRPAGRHPLRRLHSRCWAPRWSAPTRPTGAPPPGSSRHPPCWLWPARTGPAKPTRPRCGNWATRSSSPSLEFLSTCRDFSGL